MLKERIQKALNEQIQAEFHSAYLYLAMSAWSQARNFEGFAHWMRMQAQEELLHAMKFFDYVHATGRARPAAGHRRQPDTEWADPAAMFQAALAHERHMTENINNLAGPGHEGERLRHQHHAAVVRQRAGRGGGRRGGDPREAGDDGRRPGLGMFMLDRELAGQAGADAAGGRLAASAMRCLTMALISFMTAS